MLIELLGVDCPSVPGVTIGVQRGSVVVDEQPADGRDVRWLLDVTLADGPDLRGPYVHGRPGGRFLYLSWQHAPEGMFRRAKLMLDAVPPELLLQAAAHGLHARLGLTLPDGSPVCAAVRPPRILWSASVNPGR